jgi:hypothetical protein
VDDLLAYTAADPTPKERNDGFVDQYEFQQQLKDLKAQNVSLWTRYGLHYPTPNFVTLPLSTALPNPITLSASPLPLP